MHHTAPESTAAKALATTRETPALRSPAAHVRFWLVVMIGLIVDLSSKHWAFHELRQGGGRVLIPNVLEFHTTLNPGALFGIGAGHTEVFLIASVLALALVVWMFAQSSARRWLMQVALGAILAGALGNMYDRVFVHLLPQRVATASGPAVLYFSKHVSPDGEWIELREYPDDGAGIVRRLPATAADELAPIDGHVRDFIKIPTRWFGEREVWPWVFNVADMLLVGGVGILAVRLLFDRDGAALTPADQTGQATTDAGCAVASADAGSQPGTPQPHGAAVPANTMGGGESEDAEDAVGRADVGDVARHSRARDTDRTPDGP